MEFEENLKIFSDELARVLDLNNKIGVQEVKDVAKCLKRFSRVEIEKTQIRAFIDICRRYFLVLDKFSRVHNKTHDDFFILRNAMEIFYYVAELTKVSRYDLVTKMIKIFATLAEKQCNIHYIKEFLRIYLLILCKTPKQIIQEASPNFFTFGTLGEYLRGTTDIELQAIIVDVLLKLFDYNCVNSLLIQVIPELKQIYGKSRYEISPYKVPRIILQHINNSEDSLIFSCCCQITFDDVPVTTPVGPNENTTYDQCLYFDLKNYKISFFSGRNFFESISESKYNVLAQWENLSFFVHRIMRVSFDYSCESQDLCITIFLRQAAFNLFCNKRFSKVVRLVVTISRQEHNFFELTSNVLPYLFPDSFYPNKLNFSKDEETMDFTCVDFDLNLSPVLSKSEKFRKATKISSINPEVLKPSCSEIRNSTLGESDTSTKPRKKISTCKSLVESEVVDTFKDIPKGLKTSAFKTIMNKSFGSLSLTESLFEPSSPKKLKISTLTEIKTVSDKTSKKNISLPIVMAANTKVFSNVSNEVSDTAIDKTQNVEQAFTSSAFVRCKVENWLKTSAPEVKKEGTKTQNLDFSFLAPPKPTKKIDCRNTIKSELDCRSTIRSETSSSLLLEHRIEKWIKEDIPCTSLTRTKSNKQFSSQDLLNILNDNEVDNISTAKSTNVDKPKDTFVINNPEKSPANEKPGVSSWEKDVQMEQDNNTIFSQSAKIDDENSLHSTDVVSKNLRKNNDQNENLTTTEENSKSSSSIQDLPEKALSPLCKRIHQTKTVSRDKTSKDSHKNKDSTSDKLNEMLITEQLRDVDLNKSINENSNVFNMNKDICLDKTTHYEASLEAQNVSLDSLSQSTKASRKRRLYTPGDYSYLTVTDENLHSKDKDRQISSETPVQKLRKKTTQNYKIANKVSRSSTSRKPRIRKVNVSKTQGTSILDEVFQAQKQKIRSEKQVKKILAKTYTGKRRGRKKKNEAVPLTPSSSESMVPFYKVVKKDMEAQRNKLKQSNNVESFDVVGRQDDELDEYETRKELNNAESNNREAKSSTSRGVEDGFLISVQNFIDLLRNGESTAKPSLPASKKINILSNVQVKPPKENCDKALLRASYLIIKYVQLNSCLSETNSKTIEMLLVCLEKVLKN